MSNEHLILTAAGMTHLGRVRANNEDCIGIGGWMRGRSMTMPVTLSMFIDEPTLCVVADGMGGHACGEVASALAVRELMRSVQLMASFQEVGDIVNDANARIFEAAALSPQLSGMGATVVGAVFDGSIACIFNVGDCRAYIQKGPYLQLVSEDDTLAFQAGNPSSRTGTQGHGVIQCLGGSPALTAISPHVVVREFVGPTRIILCSDGLTDMLDQDGIEACLDNNAAITVTRLLEAALAEGGSDNISVLCLDLALVKS